MAEYFFDYFNASNERNQPFTNSYSNIPHISNTINDF